MIIERPELSKRINKKKKWTLVYGRRKTGKTFLVKNFTNCDDYFFVKRDRTVISGEEKMLNYETLQEILRRNLKDGKTVAVDEFHRLGEDFLDFLQNIEKQGKLILVTSTLWLTKKMLSAKSPILGLFAEMPVPLINIEDSVKALKDYGLSKKELLEFGVLLSEPLAVDYFDPELESREIFSEVVQSTIKTIPALVGEIFTEEERSISSTYEGILRATAQGKVVSGEISSYLFSRRLIKKDDPSVIQQYLNNLVSFGILKKMKIFGKNRFVYKHESPLMRIFYYADEKYNISERTLGRKEVERIVDQLLPKIVEDEVREYFAEKYGLKETILQAKDFEVDGCLLKFKKPEVLLEVKWKKKDNIDVKKAERKLSEIEAKRRILFVPDKEGIDSSLEVMDVGDMV